MFDEGIKVKVYYNLHKNCFSVLHKNPKGSWVILFHTHELYLTDVHFKVSEAGRQRVLREKQKNVHAFVCGIYNPLYNTRREQRISQANIPVTYNPYKYSSFVFALNELPVYKMPYARLVDKKVFV